MNEKCGKCPRRSSCHPTLFEASSAVGLFIPLSNAICFVPMVTANNNSLPLMTKEFFFLSAKAVRENALSFFDNLSDFDCYRCNYCIKEKKPILIPLGFIPLIIKIHHLTNSQFLQKSTRVSLYIEALFPNDNSHSHFTHASRNTQFLLLISINSIFLLSKLFPR